MRRFVAAHFPELVAFSHAGFFAYFAIWQYLIWRSDTSVAFFPVVWPWVFAVAAVLDFGYGLRPGSRRLAAWSGGFMVAGLLSRGFAVLVAWFDGTETIPGPRVGLAVGVWTFVAFAVSLIWILMRPLGRVRCRSVR